jgi:hypothetical protein
MSKKIYKSEFESSGEDVGFKNLLAIEIGKQTLGEAIYPSGGTIFDRWMEIGREQCESEDSFILGALLPVCGAILGRNVWVDFGVKKYPNIFTMLAAKAGLRKSTVINLTAAVAKEILKSDRFTSAIASEEALFVEYCEEQGGCPDKLLIADEGNTILSNWSNSNYGKSVAKRYLELYDCKNWRQSFKQNATQKGNGESVVREIGETSTSILMGATLGIAKFQGLESRDGMRRRFLPYLSSTLSRTIYWPNSLESRMFSDFCMDLSQLGRLKGEIKFTENGFKAWKIVQDRNRGRLQNLPKGTSEATDALASLLASEPMHVLKIAMIFACCRAISPNSAISTGVLLDEVSILLAHKHVENCIVSAIELDSRSDEVYTKDAAEKIYDAVRERLDVFKKVDGSSGALSIMATKTQLTKTFAHDTRRGSLTISKLYDEIIPRLIEDGKCSELKKKGRARIWIFNYDG